MKKIFFSIAIGLFFIALIVYFKKNLNSNETNSLLSQEKRLEINKLNNIENNKKIKSENSNSDLINHDIEILKSFNKQMIEIYTNIHFDKDFVEKFDIIYSKNKNIVNEVTKILLDNDYAKSNFGDEQSYARIFAIKMLEEIAKKYDKDPLINTVKEISIFIENNKINYRGAGNDLEELLFAYIRVNDIDDFSNNIESHLLRLGYYNKDYSENVRNIYEDAIFFSLKQKYNRKETSEKMKQIFK